MRRTARGLRHHALNAAALLCATADASAHGPAPVALEVLAHDGRAPTVLRTNIGLAVANGDGTYAYVCPSRWDGNELALAAGARGGEAILVHSAGGAFLSLDRGCTFSRITGDDLYVDAAATFGDGFLLVADEYPDDLDPSRSRLIVVETDGEQRDLELALPGEVDGVITTATGVLMAGHFPLGFVATEEGVVATFEASTSSRLTPRAAGADAIWLRSAEGSAVTLARVVGGGLELAALRATTVQGPVFVGDRWYALFDGALFAFDAGEWSYVDEVPWTCLRSFEGRNFACSLTAMHELAPAFIGPLPEGTPVFAMRQIGAPDACGDADAREACGLDWAHFGGEAGWLETLPATSPTTERRVDLGGGCATAPPPAGGLPWGVALLVVAIRRRALRRTRA